MMSFHVSSIAHTLPRRLCLHSRAGVRTVTTSRSLYDDKAGGAAPEGPLSIKDFADIDISQVALETGSNTGLAFVAKNVMGALDWVKGFSPFRKSEVLWNDVVTPKLTHFYIPSVYEFIQNNTGLPWFVVIAMGTLTLRVLLLPLTRRALRWPILLREVMPKFQAYDDLINVYKDKQDTARVKKLKEWKQDLIKNAKGASSMASFMGVTFAMITINRSLRHLAHLTPLMDGGIGPFVDMTVNSHSGVGFYCLPVCVVAGLGATFHVNAGKEQWYNPRIYLLAAPVGGVFVYAISSLPVAMTLHYAISAWFTAGLNITQRYNHKLLGLPPPYNKPAPPPKLKLTREIPASSPQLQIRESDLLTEGQQKGFGSEDHVADISPSTFNHYDQKSDTQFLEELTGKKATGGPINFDMPYTPVFKLGQYSSAEEGKPGSGDINISKSGDNAPPPPPTSGFMQQAVAFGTRWQIRKRFRAWYFRQKLMRHGRKGKMSLFLEDAPQEMNFIKDPVELTTKVTPGLKRYVLRRQYPMDTLEELDRKVSYIERVQGQRW